MIQLHRLRGERFLLNPDLIEAVEATPDTVVTLVDGRKVYVAEAPDEVAELILQFRAEVLYACESPPDQPSRRAGLTVLPGYEE